MKTIRYVITGGPGSGKTAIVKALREKGYVCVDESARKVIKQELKKKSNKLPWKDYESFNMLVLKECIKEYENNSGLCFYDRGIPDIASYFLLGNKPAPDELIDAAKKYKYEKTVFLVPPWKKIFLNDRERREKFRELEILDSCLRKVYRQFGYNLIILPKVNVEDRIKLILSKIKDDNELDSVFMSLPEIKAGKDIWQNKFHEFDVYRHTLEYVNALKTLTKDRNLIAAGYLHDIGKPVTAKPEYSEDLVRKVKPYHDFHGHESIGKQMVLKMSSNLFKKLGLNQKKIAELVGAHYLPMLGIKPMRKTTNYNNFLKEFKKLNKTLESVKSISKEEILLMFLADKLGQGKFCTDKEELFLIKDTLLGRKNGLKKIFLMQKKYNKEPIHP